MQSIKFPGVRSLQIVDPDGKALSDVVALANGKGELRFDRKFLPPATVADYLVELQADGASLLILSLIHI